MYILLTLLLSISFQCIANDINNDIEEVVAYGIRPGPELWKVSNGENVLWILGSLSPLPKKFTWHTGIVKNVITDSQVLLMPSTLTTDIGFFKGLSLAASVIGVKKNPNKQKLKDIIPEKLYSRWLILKNKYIGNNNSIEKIRPLFAANKLFQKAIEQSGLNANPKTYKKVQKIAKKNKLEIITPTIILELNNPKAAIKKFKKSELNDLECFSKTIERLEVDLEAMKLRANAWANGDITKIKSLPYPNDIKACSSALLSSNIANDIGLTNIRTKLRSKWLKEAIKSLANNKSTFAVLPISNLVGDNSYLNDFPKEDYIIKSPK